VERVAGPIRLKKPKAGAAAAKAAVKKEPVAWVEVVEGHTTARSPIQLEAETGFGRSAEHAQIVFVDKTVSRLHARIVPEHGGKYRVYNQSTQNTWVNEQRVPEHGLLLQDGDVIRMGQVRLRFRTKQR
jgi:predicted component of type VI protein secretion system